VTATETGQQDEVPRVEVVVVLSSREGNRSFLTKYPLLTSKAANILNVRLRQAQNDLRVLRIQKIQRCEALLFEL
jgi:hypothetical protein